MLFNDDIQCAPPQVVVVQQRRSRACTLASFIVPSLPSSLQDGLRQLVMCPTIVDA